MSAKEVLDIVVYSEEIDIALQKIRTPSRASRGVTDTKKKVDAITKMVESKDMREFIKNIPSLTRAQRLIATQLPFMREALQVSFRSKLVAGADPATMVIILSIYLLRTIKQMQEQIKQERINYENMLQEGLDLNYNELKGLLDIQTGFATWYDQFLAAIETEGFLQAVKSIVNAALPAILTSPSTELLVTEGFAVTGQIRDWWMIPNAEDMIDGNSIPID